MSRIAFAISRQRRSGSPSQPWPKLTMTRPRAVARCSDASSAMASAEGGRAIRSCDAGGIPASCSDRHPTHEALHAAEDGMAPSSRP